MPAQQALMADAPKTWKYRLGMALFIYSFVPVCTIELVVFLGLPASMAVTVGAVYLASGELALLVAVALLGKPFVTALKDKVKGFFLKPKTAAKPKVIGRFRHACGITLFVLSIVPYYATMVILLVAHPREPDLQDLLFLLLAGEGLFLISLFVLGEEFWARLKKLFEWPGKDLPAGGQA